MDSSFARGRFNYQHVNEQSSNEQCGNDQHAKDRRALSFSRTQVDSMKSMLALAIAFATLGTGCSSHPIVPEAKNVEVSRNDAGRKCREIGPVQGSVVTAKGTVEQAIENMKLDAARKGANFVRMETTSALGTSVSGTAYFCP